MFLFFDTETTGLSRKSDHVVQVAWILANKDGDIEAEECHVIRPDGYSIPWEAAKIHGITTAIAQDIGKPLKSVLKQLSEAANKSTVVIAHNLSFDLGILQADYDNANLAFPFYGKTQVCTMKLSTTWCRLPKLNGSSGFKWPKLEELHYRLFGESFDGAHDAQADTRACMRCYFELVDRGIISSPPLLRSTGTEKHRGSGVVTACGDTRVPQSYYGQYQALYDELRSQYGRTFGHPTLDINELRKINSSKLVTEFDCKEFGDDLISAVADIARFEIGEKQQRLKIEVQDRTYYDEEFGDDLVDLARRIALSIAFCSSFVFASRNEEESFGDDLVELLVRIALREEAKLVGRYAAADIEDPIRCKATHSDPAIRATAASDLLCPEGVQLLLIDDVDESVVAALAANPLCSKKVFAGFQARLNGNGLEWEISAALLANPACPVALLGILAADYLEPEVCKLVAGNPSCSPEMLADICWCCGSSSPATAVARRNPTYSEAEFRKLIENRLNEGAIVRAFVAEREDTPADILTRLAYDQIFSVRRYVASNIATPEDALLFLSQQNVYSDGDDEVMYEDLDDDDPDLGPEHVRGAALRNPSNPLYQAKSTDTSLDRLGELACHHSVEVRRLAAANPNAPSNAIHKLALDSDEGTRIEAAENIIATAATLVKLANDSSTRVRAAVAANPSCPKHLFKIFAVDNMGEVRMAAGLNPNCTFSGLAILASSQFYEYRVVAASHRNCTVALFKQLAADREKVVRIAVVKNIHCPIEIRAPLYMIEGSGLDEPSAATGFDDAEYSDDVEE